jgi:hypothetical protein
MITDSLETKNENSVLEILMLINKCDLLAKSGLISYNESLEELRVISKDLFNLINKHCDFQYNFE